MIWQRDEGGVFHFAALQSAFAQEFLLNHGVESIDMDTMYVYDQGEVFSKSRAVGRIGKHLRGKRFKIGTWLIEAFPVKSWLDVLYDIVSRNRYRMPQKENCALPPTEVRARFIA